MTTPLMAQKTGAVHGTITNAPELQVSGRAPPPPPGARRAPALPPHPAQPLFSPDPRPSLLDWSLSPCPKAAPAW